MLFKNNILSSFFQILKNKDKNPDNSLENEEFKNNDDKNSDTQESIIKNDDVLQQYLDSLMDLNINAILVSKNETVNYAINNSLDKNLSSNIKISVEFSYKLMLSQRKNISNIIGNINYTIFSYNDYAILYYEIENTFIVIVTSTASNLAQSIKIANFTKDKIIENISN